MEGLTIRQKRVKSVAFNVDLEDEKRLYKFISRRNFSGYVKQLIARDLERYLKKKAQEKRS